MTAARGTQNAQREELAFALRPWFASLALLYRNLISTAKCTRYFAISIRANRIA
jgi:hypothetical protein